MRAALILVAVGGGACATATNYLDPDTPRYETGEGQIREKPRELRVVTFNIENGRRIAQAIAGLRGHSDLRSADVLVLQEMDASGVASIGRALALNAVYYPATHFKGRDLGNAVLSRWPIESSWKVLLPHRSRIVKKARAAVAARVRVGGQSIVVYSVHLGSPIGFSSRQRTAQAEAVLADTIRIADPVVVAGDFNSSSVAEVFERAGFDWPTKTVGASAGALSLDHILWRSLAGRASVAGVAREVKDASDHRPVWAVLPAEEARPFEDPPRKSAP